jgi:dihydrolipoamide dehydrogenase
MADKYGLIVIGAGPGGYVAAVEAAKLGIKTAVVENREIGGTCLNRGCIPTKTFVHATELLDEIRICDRMGIKVSAVSYDVDGLYARKNEVVEHLQSGIESLFKKNKIDLIKGKAVIEGEGVVRVIGSDDANVLYNADNILIASGSKPAQPLIPGLDLPGVVTSDDLLGARHDIFSKLIIIGGGVIGVELASIYNALGTEVTIIEAADRIVPFFDKEVSQSLSMILKKKGVAIYTGAMVKNIEYKGDLNCCFTLKGKEETVTAEGVLIAIGRVANTEGLLAETVDLGLERGEIPVDKNFETCVKGIYAIGDVVKGTIKLAHMASAQGTNVAHIIAGAEPPIELSLVPSCLYTSPEIASVGITADTAKAQGISVKTGKALMSANGKTIIEMADRGFIKLIFNAETDVLLGAQLMCCRATDMIGELAVAIANKLTIRDLRKVIKPHPTFNEAIRDAIEAAFLK